MKKKEAEGIGALILIGIVAYPFVWLYEQIGGIGLAVCAAALVGTWIWWHIYQSKGDQQAFDELALYALKTESIPMKQRKSIESSEQHTLSAQR